ncbi:MAG TPA: HypC/HybG/HupF family hydrogenase formation chaperone [Rhodobacteraceae bacterium]|nr:HypC/HybG/HupF family hydrogenase formation chaperone [Paracoccaceae bacterium]
MCLGIPMQVIESHSGHAICAHGNGKRRIDTMLVGDQPPGTWLLVFIDAAREILSPEDAERIGNALNALDDVMAGGSGNIDAMFADIIAAAEERDRRERG